MIVVIYERRSVFGGTVGPNPMKPSSANEPQYYEGIKVRAQPLVINIQSPASNPVTPPQPTPTTSSKGSRRIKQPTTIVSTTISTSATHTSPNLTVLADNSNSNETTNNNSPPQPSPSVSPASPILKAQLSAPPKQRDANSAATTPTNCKGDTKSQVNYFNQRI